MTLVGLASLGRRRRRNSFDSYITAFYAGSCALNDDHDIVPGTRIGHTSRGWACNRCVRDSVR